MRQYLADPGRLAALDAFNILDTPREGAFDDAVHLARTICGTAVAAVNLLAADRQWFKAEAGLGVRETPLDGSICGVAAMLAPGLTVVPDTLADPRFADSPLLGTPPLRFYAGAVLQTAEGFRIGTLCVLDPTPRPEGLTEAQTSGLTALARQVMAQLELRRALAAVGVGARSFRAIAETVPQMIWSARPDGHVDYFNRRWHEFTGGAPGAADGDGWAVSIHPEDLPATHLAWNAAVATGEPYFAEYRVRRHDGAWRWFIARATPVRDAEGRIERWFGTSTDVDDLKQAEAARELLARELNHRMRNIFTLIGGLVSITSRSFAEATDYADALRVRISALARAHEFVTPVEADAAAQGGLPGLLEVLLAPYPGTAGADIVIDVPDLPVGPRAATALALILHEQATNALKYGGLSRPGGRVAVTARAEGDRLLLVWRETGGPAIDGPPSRSGFGTMLAARSAEGHLNGKITHDWQPEGLVATLSVPLAILDS
ncbi:PAS domain S-box-containing protein [Humitalea rosea]|uniref:histidine kinase n=1 Tax=Humitalea rosea TaxID=990373 RepID=A0A2W7IF07_9PROT|nr:PAS domain-containing protein [Humitalea rosea]PZW45083.1 PAS domain S-box-containing protein [Humitalea rosea]